MNEILIWTNLGFGLFALSLILNLFNTYRNIQHYKLIGNTVDSPAIFFATNIPIIALIFTDSFIVAIISFFLIWFLSNAIAKSFFI
jgi:hypothetical protein